MVKHHPDCGYGDHRTSESCGSGLSEFAGWPKRSITPPAPDATRSAYCRTEAKIAHLRCRGCSCSCHAERPDATRPEMPTMRASSGTRKDERPLSDVLAAIPTRPETGCTGPFSSAHDCPTHRPQSAATEGERAFERAAYTADPDSVGMAALRKENADLRAKLEIEEKSNVNLRDIADAAERDRAAALRRVERLEGALEKIAHRREGEAYIDGWWEMNGIAKAALGG